MTSGSRRGATLARQAIRALPLFAVVALCGSYVARGASNPWDFTTYYYAGLAARSGGDPYSLEALSALAGRQIELPYLYPPFTLALLHPFTYLPLADAARVWLLLQSVLVLVLIRIWSRRFLPRVPVAWIAVVTLLGFNAAALWGLRTGNVVIVEATLLWLGFSAFARGRLTSAAMLIGLAGAFKLFPLAFLSLLALGPERPVRKLVAIGTGVSGIALLLVATSDLTGRWVSVVSAAPLGSGPGGEINPSTPALIASILSVTGLAEGARLWLAPVAYATTAVIVLACSWGPFRRFVSIGSREGMVALGALVWLLLSPRVMVYTFVLAIAPSLYAIWRSASSAGMRSAGCVALIAQGLVRFLPGPPPAFLWSASLILTAAIWLLLVRNAPEPDAGPSRVPVNEAA